MFFVSVAFTVAYAKCCIMFLKCLSAFPFFCPRIDEVYPPSRMGNPSRGRCTSAAAGLFSLNYRAITTLYTYDNAMIWINIPQSRLHVYFCLGRVIVKYPSNESLSVHI